MGFKNWPCWLKGGLIGVGAFIVIYILLILAQLDELYFANISFYPNLRGYFFNPDFFNLMVWVGSYLLLGIITCYMLKMKNKKLGISLSLFFILSTLSIFQLSSSNHTYHDLNIFLIILINTLVCITMIPLMAYLSLIAISKIKKTNKVLYWGLLISSITLGLCFIRFLFQYSSNTKFYIFNFIRLDFFTQKVQTLLISTVASPINSFFSVVLYSILVFAPYFILGCIIGFIVNLFKSKFTKDNKEDKVNKPKTKEKRKKR